ncbi:MAG: DNA repair protein RecO [Alphaproteobacteria bacterium RIFCSPLOWO2_01_FULL_40_26]|nr:MAG: DNA repair protein RecO [Alphaproteobacteria bacterium RIFCSPHIGHO2_02_FULL_40_34]OFW88933.1 MAG: DNA repair protein RecO [Alphaproteobacteria bacterium RIFCSPHIGHO2_01_FULL_40_8]OFW95532.1 MAG: DNA repair protein RecO [Alphaproteobacteria bacterium RIFCSPLOWO2_01_FULL_40_26]OFX09628.1 MAG: DNA repair protein RecO [Alphaproteobacteria bacterium RIFCSPLOWO2_02_FULL_40_19]OFX11341.1 MAG: DNA repair protein RecO [Alphaproteobacteria bacterium RIFCSPLOWO2_12_FULL_40_11]
MKFSDEGIIIGIKKYGENSAIVKVFSHNHGIYRGFVKSVKSAKTRAIYQIGNLISFEFRCRIEENLGSFFAVDLIKSYCSKIIFDQLKLNCTSSLFSTIDELFLERENHADLFEEIQIFLQKIVEENCETKNFLAHYIRLELQILKTLGYGIDLSSCVVTNTKVDLAFVSPKSARAVSFAAGKNYQKQLLKLPNFLIEDEVQFDEKHLLEGLELSGFFMQKFLFEEGQKPNFYRSNIIKFCAGDSYRS